MATAAPKTTPRGGRTPAPAIAKSVPTAPPGAVFLEAPFAEYWIVGTRDLEYGDFLELRKEDITTSIPIMTSLITDWNFRDKRGEPMPVGDFTHATFPLIYATLMAYIRILKQETDVPLA